MALRVRRHEKAKGAEMIAMVHVHGTTALLNSNYNELLKISPPSAPEVQQSNELIGKLRVIAAEVAESFPILDQIAPVVTKLRSAVFLLRPQVVEPILEAFGKLPYVQRLVERAVSEVDTYVANGIKIVEVENVGAPYFVGSGSCPWEELLIIHLCAGAVAKAHPTIPMGVHILSANELEVLPIAIAHGAFFVRSEATLFTGVRPEGEVPNNSNLARFMYARHTLRQLANAAEEDARFPQIWSDMMKKHTVFSSELGDLKTWLHNLTFMKIEGTIITGAETGSNVDEASLKTAREEIDKVKGFNVKTYGTEGLPALPLITGSGLDFNMYAKYADFIIVGTALKKNKYWENEVDAENVKATVAQLAAANASSGRQ